jgi:serralysin
MSSTYAIGGTLPQNPWLSGITWGGNRWFTPSSPSLTTVYYDIPITYKGMPSVAEADAFTQVISDIERICNIDFVRGDTLSSDILLFTYNAADMESLSGDSSTRGIADTPGDSFQSDFNYLGFSNFQASVNMNHDVYYPNALYKGGFDYMVMMHEIGHALGLAHPHDIGGGSTIFSGVYATGEDEYSLGLGNLNQGIFTVMSYNAGWEYYAPYMPPQYGWQSTMMAFDVAALQYLYGANMTAALGDDYYWLRDTAEYGASYQCIWDAGGTDAIYYGGNLSVQIDIRAATLDPSGSYGAGGFVSFVPGAGISYWGFTIANGVTIENAFAGNGNDVLIGNDIANILYAYSGEDTIYGLDGADFIWAGAGKDILHAGSGDDFIIGSDGSDYLYGEGGKDNFYLNQDFKAGDLDYIFDLAYGTDFIIVPTAYQGGLYYLESGGASYCYAPLTTGGAYVFGAAGLTAAQLQASVFFYGS